MWSTRSHFRAEPYGQSHHREVQGDAPAKLWQVLHVSRVCRSIPDLSFPRGGQFCLHASATPRRRKGCMCACRQVEVRVISPSLCSCLQENTQAVTLQGFITNGINTHVRGRQCNHSTGRNSFSLTDSSCARSLFRIRIPGRYFQRVVKSENCPR